MIISMYIVVNIYILHIYTWYMTLYENSTCTFMLTRFLQLPVRVC